MRTLMMPGIAGGSRRSMAAVASPYGESMGSYSPLTRRVVLVRALPSQPNLVCAVSQGLEH